MINIKSSLFPWKRSLPITHLQLLQGFGSHVGILEVDKGTETLVKNFDALNLTKPVTMETQSL